MMRVTVYAGIVALGIAPLGAGPVWAETCLSGGCHQPIVDYKFVHGPVAAEEAGVQGCVSCHEPAGAACTASAPGKFRFKTKKNRLCLMCHDRGTGTQHTRARGKCLSCHAPHGSDRGITLMRSG